MSANDTAEERRRCADVFQQGVHAGLLEERANGGWRFCYRAGYSGSPVSLTMRVGDAPYEFAVFPPVFEGLLPEGPQLEALLRIHKIDRDDAFRQLVTVGADVVGSLTIQDITDDRQEERA